MITFVEISEAVVRRCSIKNVFLKISQNSWEKNCARVSFLVKLQAWGTFGGCFWNLHKTCFGHNILQSSLKFHHTFDIFFDVAVVVYTVTHWLGLLCDLSLQTGKNDFWLFARNIKIWDFLNKNCENIAQINKAYLEPSRTSTEKLFCKNSDIPEKLDPRP